MSAPLVLIVDESGNNRKLARVREFPNQVRSYLHQ